MDTSDRVAAEHTFATQRNPRLRLIIPLIVAIAFMMEQLDSTIIVTAIPDMAKSLDATPLQMNLAVTTYVLTLAVFIPVSGWFADRFGARKIFALSLLIFTIGSALCGAAQNFEMLVATRALQGLGGAMMTPVGRLILLRSFPKSELIRAMTYMTLPTLIGPVAGPLLGGFFTTYVSWRWIFYVNLPFGLLGIFMALRFIDDTAGGMRTKFDFPGFLMVGIGVASLQFGIENIGHQAIGAGIVWAFLLASALLLVGFTRYARRIAAPAVDLSLFRVRSFKVGTLAGGLCRVGLNGGPFLLPLMLQIGFGMSPIASGSLTFISAFGALLVRPLSGGMLKLFGFRPVLIGSAIAGSICLAGSAILNADSPHWIIGAYALVFGVVRAMQFMTSNTLSYADMPRDRLSRATSLAGVLQQLTVSFGVSISATLLGLVASQSGVLSVADFHEAFLLTAILPLLAIPGFFPLRQEDGVQVSGHRIARPKPAAVDDDAA